MRKILLALAGLGAIVALSATFVPRPQPSGPPVTDPSLQYRVRADGVPYAPMVGEESREIMPSAKAAIDGTSFTSSKPISAAYYSAPSTLVNGDLDVVHTDANHNLLVTLSGATGASASQTQGNVAHDAADSGNPVKIGGIGRATVEAAASTAADRVNASFTLEGRLRTEDASGYTAHDAADAGNPIKIGGKGSAAVAADVTEGDRVNASFTLAGRLRTESLQGTAAAVTAPWYVRLSDGTSALGAGGIAVEVTGSGDVAHDGADSGNPLKIGGKGSAAVAADVAEGDRVNASFSLAGRARTEDQAGYTAHDAADAGNPLKIGGKGSAAVAADVGEGDRVNASFTLAGRLRTEALQGTAAAVTAPWFVRLSDGTSALGAGGIAVEVTGSGDVAHDGADIGNPIKIGGKGSAAVAADVAEGDRTNASFTLAGRARTEDQAGYTAHDAADAGNPLKIGGKGSAAVAADVAESDRVNASFTLAGRLRTEDASGYTAHDAADAGNPIKIGAFASADIVAAVAESDRVNLSSDLVGRLRVLSLKPEEWTANHTPAANTQATITKAAGAAGVKHVCTSVTATFSGNASSAAAVGTVFNLRDGTTGAGTILWTGTIWLTATAGDSKSITLGGLAVVGTAATAMTLEAAAAGGANTVQAVSMTGYSTK